MARVGIIPPSPKGLGFSGSLSPSSTMGTSLSAPNLLSGSGLPAPAPNLLTGGPLAPLPTTNPTSPNGGVKLRKDEEHWAELIERLQERFPGVSYARIVQALRDNQGHAGQAAADLRDFTSDIVKELDPDDSEHVATLLSNHALFKQACKTHYKKYDTNRNGVLEWEEVHALTTELSQYLGLAAPSEGRLKAFFESSDANRDGVLSEREFTKFFEAFLRYAFFLEHRRLVGSWRYRAEGVERGHEFAIGQTKDYRLQFKCKGGKCPGGPRLEIPAGKCEVSGYCELKNGWLQADLKFVVKDAERRIVNEGPYGVLRLRQAENGIDRIVINYSADADEGWGPDVLASRHRTMEEERLARAVAPTVGATLRCHCPEGVPYRRSPSFIDRIDGAICQEGECVQVVERYLDTHWIRVTDGWLPTCAESGQALFELLEEDEQA